MQHYLICIDGDYYVGTEANIHDLKSTGRAYTADPISAEAAAEIQAQLDYDAQQHRELMDEIFADEMAYRNPHMTPVVLAEFSACPSCGGDPDDMACPICQPATDDSYSRISGDSSYYADDLPF